MTTIFYAEPELVLAHGRKVLFLNPNDLQIFKEIELPSDLSTCGLKIAANETAEEQRPAGSAKGEGKATAGANAEVAILNVCYSPDRQLIALTTGGQKALLLYESRPENAKLLSARALARASSALTFASDSSSVLVTDKTGDCYQYDCVEVEATPRLLLGHLSIVYDILWTSDQQHIITCDRDDKIRVTNYPATFDIHSYCLGHKEFVSGLALLTDEYLVSVSGDKTLRVWNFMAGKELLRHELPAPAVRLQLRVMEPDRRYRVAVLFYDYNQAIGLYDLALDEHKPEIWTITRAQLVCAEAGAWNISNLTLTHDKVYVVGAQDERLALRVYNTKDGEHAKTVPPGWLEMVIESFADQTCVPEDLSVWFKKRFDNVSEYMERKKRRIEDQQQQQKS